MSEYTNPVCRGSWSLGTACGKCARCLATRPQPSAEPVAWMYELDGSRRIYETRFPMQIPGWTETLLYPASALEAARREDQARIAALEADKARLMGLVKEAGEALGSLVEQCRQSEKELTEAYYGTAYCGESLPLCKARATLAKIKEATDA